MADELPSEFGPVFLLEPSVTHTHTAILLHGRGSTGEEFAEELSETLLSDQQTLMQALPSWRWVFPSSQELWNPLFEERMPAWFEAHSLTEITAKQDLQSSGIRDAVGYLEGIWKSEVERLGGQASNVVLGGVSQGGAIGMWTMLSIKSKTPSTIPGAFVGASTWLPFVTDVEAFLTQFNSDKSQQSDGMEFVKSMLGSHSENVLPPTPVFLGHGTDDAYVDVELGRQARGVFSRAGCIVEWKEYAGAEQEGHWLKAPEEMDDIAHFLQRIELMSQI
ncbi:alpha/beta-hydrolase [Sarocladium strictum]